MAVLAQAPASAPVRPWPALIAAYAGVFLTISDLFKVLVAVPAIQRALDASPAVGQWILAGFQLTYAVALVTGGRLGDRYGRRRVFLTGIAVFTLASVASGLAPSAGPLIAARLVQGVGSALALPQAFSLVQVLFAPERRDRPFAVMGAVLGLSSVVGQVLGGVLLQALPWRSVFLVNVPVGLVILVAARRLMPESRAAGAGRVDGPGTALLSVALVLLVLPLIEGRRLGWPGWTWVCLAAAPVALAAFALIERRVPAPLVDLRLFRDRAFTLGAVTVLAWYVMVNAFNFVMALELQDGLRLSAIRAALAFVPFAVAFLLGSLAAGRLAPVFGRRLLVAGALVAAAGFGVLLAETYTTVSIMAATVVLGAGMGLVQTPLLNVALKGVREEHVGTASGVLSTAQQVGGSVGVALVGVVYFRAVPHGWAHAFAAGCGFGLTLVLVGLVLLLALPRAESTGRA
ncbi:MFS transporter [Actinoallomurus iriomotensis]|uniref:MFS transporter n=1 Tax=Actinoallomurus iriomotensis TaxID=478107 RepID=A0A9W6RI78_9ACTN|nr:MFS transporter [Actinoallomurus iriomotensis]GLY74507.1 MFS transporter [Actinoallomurus iriomotensis]